MKYLLCIVLLGLPALVSAQHFVVRADKMNKVYTGRDNPVTVVSGSCGCDALSVTVDKGTIRKIKGCEYSYTADEPGTVELTVYEKKGNKTTIINKNTFSAKYPETPVPTVGGRSSGDYPLSLFKKQKGIVMSLKDDVDFRHVVTSYVINVYRNRESIFYLPNSNSYFSQEAVNFFQTLKVGDEVKFTNLKGVGPDSRVQALSDLIYTMR